MKSINNVILFTFGVGAAFGAAACDSSHFSAEVPEINVEEPGQTPGEQPSASDYNEKYRPQIHYTPAQGWVNDPNGMFYADGVWHLYYQYNPSGNDWGNLSWGHATSADLIHWEEQPVALTPDELGMIFSGSAVIDKNNTAGFGANAVVAFYTSAADHQQQSMAYSLDGGKTFTKYASNPVIANTSLPDFRDPKVFWHEESGKWIMCLAKGWSYDMEIWGSSDLKNWSYLSTFTTPEYVRCNKGQWECPDLICMDYKGGKKWVMIISTNPGGPAGGSGIFYFPGQFDGTTFTADAREDYPLWLDSGADNYAGVTWHNAPDGRHVLVGWMNNWNYAGVCPVSPWRSAFTLPRELKLVDFGGKPYLSANVVAEIDGIASEWREAAGDLAAKDAYHLQVEADMSRTTTLALSNDAGERLEITVNGPARHMAVKRNAKTGDVSFNSSFSIPSIGCELLAEGSTVLLNIYVDRSSVEITAGEGITAQTNLVFPSSIYNNFSADQPITARVRDLGRIW